MVLRNFTEVSYIFTSAIPHFPALLIIDLDIRDSSRCIDNLARLARLASVRPEDHLENHGTGYLILGRSSRLRSHILRILQTAGTNSTISLDVH